jgi:hypothetical protein
LFAAFAEFFEKRRKMKKATWITVLVWVFGTAAGCGNTSRAVVIYRGEAAIVFDDFVSPDDAGANETESDEKTSLSREPFKILNVTLQTLDAAGNNNPAYRSFGIVFNQPAKNVELVIWADGSEDIFHRDYLPQSTAALFVSSAGWKERLKSDLVYRWKLTAENGGEDSSQPMGRDEASGEFKTDYCFVGEQKYHYSDDDNETDGVGRCRGAVKECVPSGFGDGRFSGVGEVVPYPWGDIVGNGVDDDCDGKVDEGRAFFCPIGDELLLRGCCTPVSSTFFHASLDDISEKRNARPEEPILIKGSNAFVYYLASDNRRYRFNDAGVIRSWFADFNGDQPDTAAAPCNNVWEISDAELAAYAIGGNVLLRPGSSVVVFESDLTVSSMEPEYYVIARYGVLRKVVEDVLEEIYGKNWRMRAATVPKAFVANYVYGPNIISAAEYNPLNEWTAATLEKSVAK